jgi:hypothetical protein
MDTAQWEAHQKFVREQVLPAAIRAALAKPMTEDERKTAEEYKRIFDGDDACPS